MRPDPGVRPEYVQAFAELVDRIARTLSGAPKRLLPIQMYVAGGAALHFHTGERISEDIDAVFSRRIVLPDNLEVAYRDADGAARLLYFDRQYNDSFALLHEESHDDSVTLTLPGVDSAIVEVRLLSPLDLAVSKIARLSDQDREDIAALARRELITASALRIRAEESMAGYIGNLDRLRNSIQIAVNIVQDARRLNPDAKRTR